MRSKELRSKLEVVYSHAERILIGVADQSEAMTGSVMPRTYVGQDYGNAAIGNKQAPKILMMAINQSRQGQKKVGQKDFDPDRVRKSLYEGPFGKEGRFSPNGYGPRALAVNLGRWILMKFGFEKEDLTPSKVHDLIAYDNFVKWPFDVAASTPPDNVWPAFHGINRAIVEILEPDIILCLGKMYDHLSDALKEKKEGQKKPEWAKGYGWEYGEFARPGWVGTLKAPWGACQMGWCYHYSGDRSARKCLNTIQGCDVPPGLKTLFGEQLPSARDLERIMAEMGDDDSDAVDRPWWGTSHSTNRSVAKYHRYKKLVATKVCELLANGWAADLKKDGRRER